MSRRVERVVVVGSDAPVWLAALALRRAFEGAGVAVHVVELAPLLRPVDVYVTLPTFENFHRLLGLDDAKVLGACAGSYVFGQRFANWSKGGPPFMHAYDTHGMNFNNVEFFQFWLRAREAGMRVDLEDFSLGAVAAKQGRFVLDNATVRSYSKALAGRHYDATAYARILKQFAWRAGVTAEGGHIDNVKREGDRVVELVLREGDPVRGDFFVDASGAESALMRFMGDTGIESWEQWLPCNRVMAASGARLDPLPAFSQISAFSVGWLGMYPLQDRTALTAVYDYNQVSDQDMLERLAILSGLRLEGATTVTAFTPGARRRPWVGNCASIGEAAGALDPLDAAPMQLLQVCISYLVSLFPVDADAMPEAAAYNASILSHARNLRDFQIAHYKLNRRLDERMWDRARAAAPPESLAHKLDLFKRRGRVALYDNETFQDSSWIANFVGHGHVPMSYDPMVDLVDEAEQMQQFQGFLRFIASQVQEMPSMDAHLEFNAPFQRTGMF